jgi:hypothetical protein
MSTGAVPIIRSTGRCLILIAKDGLSEGVEIIEKSAGFQVHRESDLTLFMRKPAQATLFFSKEQVSW